MDANLINKRACKLLRHSKIFSPTLSKTLENRTTKFHVWLINQNQNLIIDLNPHLENKSASQLSRCWELFSPSLSQTLTKLHDAVSALTRLLEFKPDHMFGCILDMFQNMFGCILEFKPENLLQNIFTPFKPNLSKTSQRSFTFD